MRPVIISATALLSIMLLFSSCTKEEATGNIILGEELAEFSKATVYTDTLHGNFSRIYASTDSKLATHYLTMSITTENCSETVPGNKLQIKEFSFCRPLSSDSRDYTSDFSGDIYLIQYPTQTGGKAIIQMKNLKCSLKGENFTFDGHLVLDIIDSPLN